MCQIRRAIADKYPEFDLQEASIREIQTLRQYAAIKLKVPDSGTDWLDAMITESRRMFRICLEQMVKTHKGQVEPV